MTGPDPHARSRHAQVAIDWAAKEVLRWRLEPKFDRRRLLFLAKLIHSQRRPAHR
jgi:hypothetical protein